MLIMPTMREKDAFGEGYFGASRGKRSHKGIDFSAPAGAAVYAICAGTLSYHGYPYADDLRFRYVQMTDSAGDCLRYFYVTRDDFEIGKSIAKGGYIGTVQDIAARYDAGADKMNNHFHLEIKRKGVHIDPTPWLAKRGLECQM